MQEFPSRSGGGLNRLKLLVLLGCLALALWGLALPAAADDWQVTAESFVIMDAKTGRILLSLKPHKLLQPASTIKIMTAMYVRERLNLHDRVRVSRYAASAPPSKVGLKPGEVYTVKELLYALLLSSANDGARALAERVSGSEKAFVRELTRKVREWGAYRTRVGTANGLTVDGQYSSAEDLAILFRRFIRDPVLAHIIGTKYYYFPNGRKLRNHDRFLFTTPLARGGKTGYTRAAKHTYVGRFAHRDKEIIIALMRSKKKWADLRTLIEKGFALAGAPIPKLPPREEKLWSGKKVRKSKRYRKSKRKRRHHTRHKKRRTSRKRAKVIVGASTSLPTKAKIIKRSP
ncbi:MAG: D-alanyl-D-alanine carboxypeptidase [Deltaproteobacteria bacterium]|nr:D-alanyl-D-alanine carboxypeptidase [Deltaproteobacteria bacterium]